MPREVTRTNRSLLLHGGDVGNGPSFNNVAMQLRHCCNHPFLIKGVEEAEGLDMAGIRALPSISIAAQRPLASIPGHLDTS